VSDAYTVDAVAHLYSYVHAVPEATVREAAHLRVEAMRLSDAWVAAGCSWTDPNLLVERRTLIASCAAPSTSKGCRRTGPCRNSAN